MTKLVPVEAERLELMEKVAFERTKGANPTAIGKSLGISRAVVLDLIEEWNFALQHDEEAKDRAREALRLMDKHYDILLGKYWAYLDELENENLTAAIAAQKLSALKGIADTEAKRLDALTKAGLLDGANLADELAEMEEKQQFLINILRTDLCTDCKAVVSQKLQKVTQTVEVVQVVE